MKNIIADTTPALGAAVRARRLELGWSQARLAGHLGVQRQWVIRLEAGSEGAEIGTVLKALRALHLSVVIGSEPASSSRQVAPAASLDSVFARLSGHVLPPPSGAAAPPPRPRKSRVKAQ